MGDCSQLGHGDAAAYIPAGLGPNHPLTRWAVRWTETRTGRWEGVAIATNPNATADPDGVIRARVAHAADLAQPRLDPDDQPIGEGWLAEVEECGGWSGPMVGSLLDAFTWSARRVGLGGKFLLAGGMSIG